MTIAVYWDIKQQLNKLKFYPKKLTDNFSPDVTAFIEDRNLHGGSVMLFIHLDTFYAPVCIGPSDLENN